MSEVDPGCRILFFSFLQRFWLNLVFVLYQIVFTLEWTVILGIFYTEKPDIL